MNRLDHLPTLRIRPEKKLFINYRGERYEGLAGDTVATALYANGIRVFSRSLKYHRPRGLYSLDGECSNTMMEVDGIANVQTENTLAQNGMVVKAQNIVGSPENDLMGFMDKLGWAMPAGFYYRVFHKPAKLWPIASKFIRKAAGLGALSADVELKDRHDEIYPTADVCVIGGGPAGMSAALAAAEQGLRIILLESRPWLGGFFEYRSAEYANSIPLYERARALAHLVEQMPNIRVLRHTSMIGIYNNNLITAFQRGGLSDPFDERYIEIRAESVVVATGCIERPLLFENNERPGIMQVACAHRLARTYGLLAGESAVFSIGDDLGLEAAIDLSDLGLKLLCVADTRQQGQDPNLVSKLEKRNILFLRGWTAFTAKGNKGLKGVTLGTKTGDRHRRFSCDILVASAGLTPVIGPLTMVQAKLQYDNHTGFFVPVKTPEKIHPAGRVLGLQHPLSVEASGRLAGLRAAADCEAPAEADLKYAEEALESLPGPARGARPIFPTRARQKVFICFDEDTTLKHIDQAMKLGFDVPELIKRFTAAGTGPGQGGIPGHNLPLYVRYVAGSPDNDPKPTTIRSPLVPTFLGTYAGSNCDISKRTPVHEPQMAGAGGKIERVGVWYRVRYFSEDKSARAEIENVRNNVGMLDSSTLGKFRIYGPDALQALQRVYVGNMSDLKEEKVKYSAMCNEDGCIKDDGVVVKRGENDYYFTTSTGRAGVTSEWIRYHTRYDGWDFHIVNLTDGFGAINLTGPNAREVLGKVTSTDLSNEGFPFTGYREFLIQDKIPVRAMRLGFLGELSYELHVPASYMPSLWELLEEAGREFNLRNFGLEAQNALRLEKGHIIIGSESEPRTTLHDLGLGFLWYRDKPEAKTVGAFALKQTESQEGRLKLVGFKLKDDGTRAPKDGSPIVDDKIRGYVCTARYSYSLKEVIGMALVEDSLSTVGTRLAVFEDDCKGGLLYAMVVSMPFYDPAGKRMRI